MSFNPSKCQVVHISKRKTPIDTCYLLHNTKLDSVTSAKYLGVTISNDLTWNTHIDNITKKANQTLGFLRRNIKVHSEPLKSTAYKTLVRPQLEYSSTVWSPHTESSISQIESIQRRAARWVKPETAKDVGPSVMTGKFRSGPIRNSKTSVLLTGKIFCQNDNDFFLRSFFTSRCQFHERYRRIP